jgi:hypothetical protein
VPLPERVGSAALIALLERVEIRRLHILSS